MCTVTFLPLANNDFILTSSRDVPFSRPKATTPKEYIEEGIKLTYPKDTQAGGTWIGSSDKNRLICLMNGGYKNHTPIESYRMSRGLIVKELLKADETTRSLNQIDLMGIEPFTLVVLDWTEELKLFEFVWTGDKKHLFNIPLIPHIWSSSTLYDDAAKKLRQDWFTDWKGKQVNYSQDEIISFHKTAGNGNPETDVLMKRKGGGTVSITSIEKSTTDLKFHYEEIT